MEKHLTTDQKVEDTSSIETFKSTKFKVLEHTLYDVIADARHDQLSIEDRLTIFNNFIADAELHQLTYYSRYSLNGCGIEQTVVDPSSGKTIQMINFASNDYLNMTQHPSVVDAAIRALQRYGAGAGASCIASGQTKIKEELQNEIADTFGNERALVFNSGYSTNIGVLGALMRSNDVAIVDMLAHASLMDGVENRNKMFFKHNDMRSLEIVLSRANRQYANKIVVIDGVYSMDGDIANIPEISALCKKYKALLYVDEAHAFGVIGKNGLGILDHFNMPPETIDILIGTLSKAVGTSGGFVTGKKKLINFLELASRTYLCTTGPFIASNAAALESIRIIKQDTERRKKLWKNVDFFRLKIKQSGFNMGNSATPIFPIILGDHNKVTEVTRVTGNNGVQVSGVTYPLVPRRQTRIRMTVTAGMTLEQLNKGYTELCNAIVNYDANASDHNTLNENNAGIEYQQKVSKEKQETLSKERQSILSEKNEEQNVENTDGLEFLHAG